MALSLLCFSIFSPCGTPCGGCGCIQGSTLCTKTSAPRRQGVVSLPFTVKFPGPSTGPGTQQALNKCFLAANEAALLFRSVQISSSPSFHRTTPTGIRWLEVWGLLPQLSDWSFCFRPTPSPSMHLVGSIFFKHAPDHITPSLIKRVPFLPIPLKVKSTSCLYTSPSPASPNTSCITFPSLPSSHKHRLLGVFLGPNSSCFRSSTSVLPLLPALLSLLLQFPITFPSLSSLEILSDYEKTY